MRSLQDSVAQVKESREMGERYMIFEEMLRDEHKEGHKEGFAEARRDDVLKVLERFGSVPEKPRAAIEAITDIDVLNGLFNQAVYAGSMEQFIREAGEILSGNREEEPGEAKEGGMAAD